MTTRFKKGDLVRSLTNEQGLTKGQTYRVTKTRPECFPWGTYTSYWVEGRELPVLNGHLVLQRVTRRG